MIILCIKLNYLIAIHPKTCARLFINLCKYYLSDDELCT